MATTAVTEINFDQTVEKGIVLIDFWAAWCGPCRSFAPVFEAASAKHPDITFGKVDTEAEPGLAAAFQISGIPTLLVFRDNVLLAAQPGALPAAALEKFIEAVRGVDMDEVRRKIDAESKGEQKGASP